MKADQLAWEKAEPLVLVAYFHLVHVPPACRVQLKSGVPNCVAQNGFVVAETRVIRRRVTLEMSAYCTPAAS